MNTTPLYLYRVTLADRSVVAVWATCAWHAMGRAQRLNGREATDVCRVDDFAR